MLLWAVVMLVAAKLFVIACSLFVRFEKSGFDYGVGVKFWSYYRRQDACTDQG